MADRPFALPDGLAGLSMLFDSRHTADPYPVYERLRSTQPIWQLDERMFVLSRHAECAAVLRDQRFGHSEPVQHAIRQDLRPAGEPGLGQPLSSPVRSLLGLNPPDHTRLRRLVATAFTPRRVDALAPRIEQVVGRFVDAIAAQPDTFDLVEALAAPLPVLVISELLGIPEVDRGNLLSWSHALARGLDPDFLLPPEIRVEQQSAREEFASYLGELLSERRSHPGPDLLSGLVAVHDERDALSEEEIVATCVLLLVAGHETTTNLIGSGVLALVRHPSELARLRREPLIVERAVEEMLRYDSPVQLTGRVALEDADINGMPVRRGAFVLSLIGAANRDPEAHAAPDQLDIGREPSRHLAFGQGIHFCLGAPLARLEAQLALRALASRFGELELVGAPVWKENVVLRGLRSLPLRASAARRRHQNQRA